MMTSLDKPSLQVPESHPDGRVEQNPEGPAGKETEAGTFNVDYW